MIIIFHTTYNKEYMKISTPSPLLVRKMAKRLATKVKVAMKQQNHKSKGIHKTITVNHSIPINKSKNVEITEKEE